jgi:hypothetical protein
VLGYAIIEVGVASLNLDSLTVFVVVLGSVMIVARSFFGLIMNAIFALTCSFWVSKRPYHIAILLPL